MRKRLSPEQRELYRQCDEVLWTVWDPIGVSGEPWPRGEYEGYVPQVFGLLWRGAGADELADHLLTVERESLGVTTDGVGARQAAAMLVERRDRLQGDAN